MSDPIIFALAPEDPAHTTAQVFRARHEHRFTIQGGKPKLRGWIARLPVDPVSGTASFGVGMQSLAKIGMQSLAKIVGPSLRVSDAAANLVCGDWMATERADGTAL